MKPVINNVLSLKIQEIVGYFFKDIMKVPISEDTMYF